MTNVIVTDLRYIMSLQVIKLQLINLVTVK